LILQVQKISKMFAATPILAEISLQLERRERVGLIGVNGAGKSTLLNIICGRLQPDDGHIVLARGATLGYLTQQNSLPEEHTIGAEMRNVFRELIELEKKLHALSAQLSDPTLTGDSVRYEAVAAQYGEWSEQFRLAGGYAYESKIRSVLHGMGFADIDLETPIGMLSGGQKTRLSLAQLLLREPDVLILDEPTNHLDIETLDWLETYLRAYPGALLVVSHDRYFLDAVVGSIYEIERTRATHYPGNYSQYLQLKAARLEQQRKEFDKQQTQIARMEEFVQRNLARASTTGRAQSRRRALERMDRIERPQGDLKKAHFSFEVERTSGKDVLRAEEMSLSFGTGAPLFRQVRLELKRGESVALLGANGIGKTSMLRALRDADTGDGADAGGALIVGRIVWGAGVKLGYFDQEQRQLQAHKSILDEVWDAFPGEEEVRIRTVLGHFLFSGEDVFKKIAALSGGEKARVALAKLMLAKANVLLLDEPTNHLDLFSKEVLEAALYDYEGTILFISHDRYFINKLAERIVELTPDGLYTYDGDFDFYRVRRQEARERAARLEAATIAAAPASDATYVQEKQAKREERAKKRKLEQAEQTIAALEAELTELERALQRPDIQHRYEELTRLSQEIEAKKQALDAAYEAWQQLMDELETS
jgi:ATP-binding cassette subfamily F protein 3